MSVYLGIWRRLSSEASVPRTLVLRAARMQHPDYLDFFCELDAHEAAELAKKREADLAEMKARR